MLRLLFLFTCLRLVSAADHPKSDNISCKFPSYDDFLKQYKKLKPNGTDYDIRKANYEKSIKAIEENEKLFVSGVVKYKLGLNYYADSSSNMGMKVKRPHSKPNNDNSTDFNKDVPAEFDWTTVTPKVVNDIRSQCIIVPNSPITKCGSCYTFGTIAVLESQYAIKYKQLLDLSEQQLVDCSTAYGNDGCSGGWAEDAYRYIIDHGISNETDYPYTAKEGKCLDTKVNPSAVKISKFMLLPQDEEKIKKYLYTFGPLSVAIVTTLKFRLYKEGILDALDCGGFTDHEVALVGYGVENGIPFWKVRNSWGDIWGEQGNFKIVRGQGACQINQEVCMPIFKTQDKH